METFEIIERNSMSMGFSHAKFGQEKNEINIFFIFFTIYNIKMFHAN